MADLETSDDKKQPVLCCSKTIVLKRRERFELFRNSSFERSGMVVRDSVKTVSDIWTCWNRKVESGQRRLPKHELKKLVTHANVTLKSISFHKNDWSAFTIIIDGGLCLILFCCSVIESHAFVGMEVLVNISSLELN